MENGQKRGPETGSKVAHPGRTLLWGFARMSIRLPATKKGLTELEKRPEKGSRNVSLLVTFLSPFLKTPVSHISRQKGSKPIENETGVVKNVKTVKNEKTSEIVGYASVFSQKRDSGISWRFC